MKTTKAMIEKIAREEIEGIMGLGESECEVNFMQCKEFKVRWERIPHKWIELQLPDYLIGMDSVSIRECLRSIVEQIETGQGRAKKDEFVAEMLSHRFIERNQPKYLKRDRSLTSDGREIIDRILERLRSEGKIGLDKDLVVVGRSRAGTKPVAISVLFKVIKLGADVMELDEDVIEYTILCAVRMMEEQREEYHKNGFARDRTTEELAKEIRGYEEQRELFLERFC